MSPKNPGTWSGAGTVSRTIKVKLDRQQTEYFAFFPEELTKLLQELSETMPGILC